MIFVIKKEERIQFIKVINKWYLICVCGSEKGYILKIRV